MPAFRIPSHRLHKPSGRAVLTLNQKDHYTGKWGTPEAEATYRRLVAEWLANDRNPLDRPEGITVIEIVERYLRHARAYYRKDGATTNEYVCIKSALRPVARLYGILPAEAFAPRELKTVRQGLIAERQARSTIQDKVARIKRMFRWATEHGLVPPTVLIGVDSVQGLRRGRSEAREPEPITVVDETDIEAVLPIVSRQVAAMIRLQLLTGMRPGEVVSMRPCDLDRTRDTW